MDDRGVADSAGGYESHAAAMTESDPTLGLALVTVASLVAAAAMVQLGLAKRRLSWRTPYCRVCRTRHRGACTIRLTL
jgi:hypothetical protein